MYQRILVPTDGSSITDKAVSTALALAKLAGAEVQTLAVKEPYPYSAMSETHLVPPQEYFDAQERIARTRVQRVSEAAASAQVSCQSFTVEASHPWQAIIEQAKAGGCDLIVMASHGRRGVSAMLLGSETQKVLTHCTLPVLVVH